MRVLLETCAFLLVLAAIAACVFLTTGCGGDGLGRVSTLVRVRCNASEVLVPVHLIGSQCAGAQGVLIYNSADIDVLGVELAADIGQYGCAPFWKHFPMAASRTGAVRFAMICAATVPDDFVPFYLRTRPKIPTSIDGWVEVGVSLDAVECSVVLPPISIACEV